MNLIHNMKQTQIFILPVVGILALSTLFLFGEYEKSRAGGDSIAELGTYALPKNHRLLRRSDRIEIFEFKTITAKIPTTSGGDVLDAPAGTCRFDLMGNPNLENGLVITDMDKPDVDNRGKERGKEEEQRAYSNAPLLSGLKHSCPEMFTSR